MERSRVSQIALGLTLGLALGIVALAPVVVVAQSADEPPAVEQVQAQETGQQVPDPVDPMTDPADTEEPEVSPEQAQQQPAADAEKQGAGDEELPRTASPLGLVLLLGLAGTGSAVGVRALRRNRG